jgi:hypothetical protein
MSSSTQLTGAKARNETTDDVTDVRVVEKCGIDVSVKVGNRVS